MHVLADPDNTSVVRPSIVNGTYDISSDLYIKLIYQTYTSHMIGKAQSSTAARRLMTEYKQLTSSGAPEGLFTAGPITESNMFEWEALIQGPEDTPYEGGLFVAKLNFPSDYPLNPFKMKFDPPILHPNVYANGEVCISILHSPGEDPHGYESSSERWSPIQSVEKVLLSVISMLAEPNVESGANIDCCKLYRDNKAEYERRVRQAVMDQLGV